ncbi:MAG: Rrf2 family transcriptional regulator [Candidatus Omnitrophota bacterium]
MRKVTLEVKLITRNTDYAIRALLCMAKKKGSVSAPELTNDLKIPKAFLRMILQVLSGKKILKSQRGKGGGFMLAIKPSKVSLFSLIEIFQGPLRLNKCSFKNAACHNIKNCGVKKKIDNIQKYVVSELRGVTLESLLNNR